MPTVQTRSQTHISKVSQPLGFSSNYFHLFVSASLQVLMLIKKCSKLFPSSSASFKVYAKQSNPNSSDLKLPLISPHDEIFCFISKTNFIALLFCLVFASIPILHFFHGFSLTLQRTKIEHAV